MMKIGAAPAMSTDLEESVGKLAGWVEAHEYRAYDPGDGDLSFLRHLTFGSHFLRRLLTGAVLRAPFHIRPWIGVRPHTSTKGMGYMGWAYAKLYQFTGEESYRRRAEHCYDWLIENRSPGWPQYCWGNHFAFSTRAGTIPRHMPTIVWSSLIGLSFLEAYEILGSPAYLAVADSVSRWIRTLPSEETSTGICLSYVPFRQSSIHNANMLGASLLSRVAQHTGDRGAIDLARASMAYSCSAQLPDGSWFYGENPKYHWIDSFHTGYNLDSLKRYSESIDKHGFLPQLRLGFDYFQNNFFEQDGCPKYYAQKREPVDIQCAAQAIDTLTYFSDLYPDALSLAKKVSEWTIRNMQDPDGHFYYRDLGWTKVKTPMFHWGQATMFKALVSLLRRLPD
jgi:hypothetical protein